MGAEFLEEKVHGTFEDVRKKYQELYEEYQDISEKTEGYSGTWGEVHSLKKCDRTFESEQEFIQWVVETGENNEAIAYEFEGGVWVIAAWAKS
ncbi:MAG TPA: hypothetical protein V6C57_10950 [Coleofasciculaceae cyanobacterium]